MFAPSRRPHRWYNNSVRCGEDAPIELAELVAAVCDARARTLEILDGMAERELCVPRLPTINPPLWESGHAGYFFERFVLQELGLPVLEPANAQLYDSISIAHETRWDLPVPDRAGITAYLHRVRDHICDWLESGQADARGRFLTYYAVLHEDMHTEALTYCLQTFGYPAPRLFREGSAPAPSAADRTGGPPGGGAGGGIGDGIGDGIELDADIAFAGGTMQLGAPRDTDFCFDNERWAHPIELAPFAISRTLVTQAQFAAFVDDAGYTRREFWSDAGWAWRTSAEAHRPLYWESRDDAWFRRDFDRWIPLELHRPMIHVAWWEAQAWCRWAGRRLPAEAEWEHAAMGADKRRYAWGDSAGGPAHANTDFRAMGCVAAGHCTDGDTPEGLCQITGDVWEWCADSFGPFPGFDADHYGDYSVPLFGSTRVLRGGAWTTRRRLARTGYRNYQAPHRRDIWGGFRTCASS